MSATLVAVTYSVEPGEDAVGRVLAQVDLLEHLSVGREHRDASGNGGAHKRAPVGGKRHPVRHVPVAELRPHDRPAVVEPADAVGGRLGPVHALVLVEGDPVRVHVGPFHQHLAAAGRVEGVELAGDTHVEAEILLGSGVGEPQAAVGAEGQVVGADQRVAGDARREQLDRPIGVDPLDAGHDTRLVAAGNRSALRDVDRAVGAEHRSPRRAAGVRVGIERAVLPAAQLAGVSVAEHDRPVAHDDGAFGEPEVRGEQRSIHGRVLSARAPGCSHTRLWEMM